MFLFGTMLYCTGRIMLHTSESVSIQDLSPAICTHLQTAAWSVDSNFIQL